MTPNLPLAPLGLAVVALIGLVALLAAAPSTAEAAQLPPGFSEDVVYSGLAAPTAVRFSPGPGDDRVFVAEKDGTIQVFEGLEDTDPTQFADLTGNVYPLSDRGLLGLELDPDFPDEPYVYVLYTHDSNPVDGGAPWGDDCPDPPGESTDGCVVTARLSKLTADLGANQMTGPEEVLIDDEWCQQYPSHSIGSLAFGPDGYLYASAGDGASFDFADWGQNGFPEPNPCGDPTAQGGALRSQDLRTGPDPTGLDGSIIRVDPATGDAAPENPTTDPGDENAERIVAHGFRNPYRFTVRPGSTGAGELWIGDVGWSEHEEINVLSNPTAGPVKNYGWPCYEGGDHDGSFRQAQYDAQGLSICESLYADEDSGPDPVEHPHYTYEHGVEVEDGDECREENGAVVSGIDFAEGGDYPAEYEGALFFGDYARGCIWTMFADGSGEPDHHNVATFAEDDLLQPVDLQVGPGGDLFYADYGFNNPDGGSIRRIRYAAPTAVASADPTFGSVEPAGLEVNFDGSESTEFDGSNDSLAYEWDLNGDGDFDDPGDSEVASPTETYTDDSQNVTVRLRVTDTDDGNATDLSDPITISPGNLGPPEVTIEEPSSHATWRVGEDIDFSAQATDPDVSGQLLPESLDWTVSIEHCPNGPTGCHVHPLENFLDSGSGSITAPNHEYPSGLIFEVEATDDRGLKATDTLKIDAARADLTFRSAPISGVELTVDTVTEETPFTRTVVAGSPHTVVAPASVVGSPAYVFGSWSDGGGRVHGIQAPEGARTYTATYRATGQPGEPPAPPQGSFELRKGERNRKRGTAKLKVEVPGPGRLDLAGKKVKSVTKEVSQAGTVEMPVKPNSKTKKKLKNTGRAKVTVEVTFTPTEGDPASETGSLKLVKKR
jgi:glucose/arabinose dehydrogenase